MGEHQHGRTGTEKGDAGDGGGPASGEEPGAVAVPSSVTGTVSAVAVAPGDEVEAGARVATVESMKMEYPVIAPIGGRVHQVVAAPGTAVSSGDAVLTLVAAASGSAGAGSAGAGSPGADRGASVPGGASPAGAGSPGAGPGASVPGDVRPTAAAVPVVRRELAELRSRRALLEDAARPEAMARHRAVGHRSARENVADLLDPGSLEEYGGFAVAAQRARRSLDDLQRTTPADGLIAGFGRVNGDRYPDTADCAVLAYDYTVLAGTQGQINHRKTDRLLELVARTRVPLVLFAEGGGGRPGDTDTTTVTGLATMAFALFARLSGLVPLVGIAAGRCFAGNAALLGCCDVVIATADASIGMGGPAMIEGGGLGVVAPEDVGPIAVQVANGVVDMAVANEAEAVAVARRYLGYFQGADADWSCADQDRLRDVLPERRAEVHDVRRVLALVADEGSVLELRPLVAPGMVTALARVEGRAVGVLANNPIHLSGAIDAAGASKAARFMALCDTFDLPIVSLVDTPGFMVGPEAEATGLVRQASRMFVAGAGTTVPWCCVVLRKAYGLGAQAMAGGSLHAPLRTVAWAGGELGGMGLEGAVRLGFRRELQAVADPGERQALFDRLVAIAYERGKAVEVASVFEIDDVIDPADTRRVITDAIRSAGPPPPRTGRKRPGLDTW